MKTIITTLMSAAFAAFVAIPAATAAEEATEVMAKPVTMEGTATCAKCDLGTADKCQSVLQVKKDGATETYMLAGKAGGDWHKNICKAPHEVKATGVVSEADGKKTLTVTDIEMTDKMKKDGAEADKG